jgi:organic radical activating enzyme
VKKRSLPESNYSAVFVDGDTLRIPIDREKDITEIAWPEFYDIAFNTKCVTGRTKLLQKDGSKSNCYYCYAASSLNGEYFPNIVQKLKSFFGSMTPNQRCFQVAIGGSGEPLEHPDFWEACEALRDMDIVPNYTTNGMLVRDDVVDRTRDICGGAAITCHPHMEIFWKRAVNKFASRDVKVNLHHIISDRESIDTFIEIYKEYMNAVDYFVLLPYMNTGHALEHPKQIDFNYLETRLDEIFDENNIAFGANFYPWLKQRGEKYDVSMYPPEIFSKYIVLDKEGTPSIYNNSFDLEPLCWSQQNGVEIGKAKDFSKESKNEQNN